MPNYQQQYIEERNLFRSFVNKELLPYAHEFDFKQFIPRSFFKTLAEAGYLGACIPKKYCGQEMDYITLGLLHEEFGKALCSVENALTVYGMVSKPLIKFGTEHQRQRWLPKISTGEIIVALAITEPQIGSDISNIKTNVVVEGESFILNGKKKYITLGQIADLFLVIAKCNNEGIALLLEKNTPGLDIEPINNILGLRANMLAELSFKNCVVPKENILGKLGNGLTYIASCALDEGRYTTACGCVGLGQACLESVYNHLDIRNQGGSLLKDHQLVQKMLAEIIVNVKAAREVCYNAAYLRDSRDFSYISETLIAKYFASKMVVVVSNYAVQIYGASGCTKEHPVERFYRDAKIMEIIEGTSQIYETLIPKIYTH